MLSFGNYSKVYLKWLWTGVKPTKEEVERAVKELKSERMMADMEDKIDLK